MVRNILTFVGLRFWNILKIFFFTLIKKTERKRIHCHFNGKQIWNKLSFESANIMILF